MHTYHLIGLRKQKSLSKVDYTEDMSRMPRAGHKAHKDTKLEMGRRQCCFNLGSG
jgi:hypothetical protein